MIYNDIPDEDNVFNPDLMDEEDKKIYEFTLYNTDINKLSSDKIEFYANKSNLTLIIVHNEIFGFPYKHPPMLKRQKKDTNNRVKFAEQPILLQG